MFYNHKVKKVKLIIPVLAIVVWAGFVIRVNAAFPDKTIVECHYNEWLDYKAELNFLSVNISLSPVSCHIESGEELMKQYQSSFGSKKVWLEKDYLVFELAVKNNADAPIDIQQLTYCFFYCSPFNGNTNSTIYLNRENKDEIEPGETIHILEAALFYSGDMFPNSFERYKAEDVYVLVSQYPVEKRLVFRIEE